MARAIPLKMYLLDTSTLLWLVESEDRLTAKVRKLLDNRDTVVFISSITGCEIALKKLKGSLELTKCPMRWLREVVEFYSIQEIPVDMEIGVSACSLPALHRDPFDRIIIATAKLRN